MSALFTFQIKKRLVILFALLLCGFQGVQAQCTWGFSTTVVPSACPANGKITVTLTGANVGNLSDIRYSIQNSGGGYSVEANSSPVFENVPAGVHKVVVTAVCSETPVTQSADVTVGGNYQDVVLTASQLRPTLSCGNYGQTELVIKNGRAPYTVYASAVPATYTGPLSFTMNAAGKDTLQHLPEGDYSFTLVDACSNVVTPQTVTVEKLPVITSSMFYAYGALRDMNSCEQFSLDAPSVDPAYAAGLQHYLTGQDAISYTWSFNGGAKQAYTNLNSSAVFSPGNGQTAKDVYNKLLTYHIKPACGTEVTIDQILEEPDYMLNYTANCNGTFDVHTQYYTFYANCFPQYLTLKSSSTGVLYKDTITGIYGSSKLNNIPFGSYEIFFQAADGYYLDSARSWIVNASTTNPYSAEVYTNASGGNDGAAYFVIRKANEALSAGTRIQITGMGNSYIATLGGSMNSLLLEAGTAGYFAPGTYQVIVTDVCGVSYPMQVEISEDMVYRYYWSVSQQLTCAGMQVRPEGYVRAAGIIYHSTYYKILSGPAGVTYDNGVVPSGGTLLLPAPGTYKIGVSSSSTSIEDHSQYGNGRNVLEVSYYNNAVRVDVNRSFAWKCPRDLSDKGKIRARGIYGITETGKYTFKLSAQGNGLTGPYFATNNTGNFSTQEANENYTLNANANYDITIVDDCGATSVQTLKVLDLTTAQLARADKISYCFNEPVRLYVMNIPDSAARFVWTGPGGYTSSLQNPVLVAAPGVAGNYHVTVYSDICGDPIESDVYVALNPYAISCYSAVTDTAVNPYVTGLLGNWRSNRSHVYYDQRTGDPAGSARERSIRGAGTYAGFSPFWSLVGGSIQAKPDTTRWVWNNTLTLFNDKGAEIENKDALGRYNSGLYGYDGSMPVAVIRNSRYQQSAFEGFEDYGSSVAKCALACNTSRHWDLGGNPDYITNALAHTGRYCLAVIPDEPFTVGAVVDSLGKDNFLLSVKTAVDTCIPSGIALNGFYTNRAALMPVFTPAKNTRMLFSAWAREEVVCKGLSYTGNEVTISITLEGGASQSITCTPAGNIIEGWQRYEQAIDIPANAIGISLTLKATGQSTVYFDDIRFHPYHANMKSFVYDPVSLRLMAELDENNYATFYEYDDDGTLIRVNKETERGIQTIKETRSALQKEE